MKIHIHKPKTIKEAINDFQTFIECDMWTKIYPIVKSNNKYWQRTDYFKSKKDFLDYMELHFDIFRKEITRLKKEEAER